MKFAGRALVFILFGALLASLAAAQVPQFPPFSGDAQITSTNDQGSSQMTAKFFVGNGHSRVNIAAKGSEIVAITDFATRTVAVLLVEQKFYIVHKVGLLEGHGPIGNTDDLQPYDPANPCGKSGDGTCKKVGVESVSGRACEHWEIASKDGKVSNVWIDEKLHFPIKMTSEYGSVVLSDIHEGEQPATLFQIPPDFRKVNPEAARNPGAGRPTQN